MKKKYSVSLIVSTYNSPDMLQLCLRSVARQTILPNEIIIADDGSTKETRLCIDRFRHIMKCPIKHVWQGDEGFQLSKIRNKAIATAKCEYIIQIDGDLILDRHFVEDHLSHAKKGFLIAGSRCKITKKKTQEVIQEIEYIPHWYSKGLENRENGLRIPFLSLFFKKRNRVIGCNMAFFLCDFMAINGYNEDFVGWGHEDLDLKERMKNAGMKILRIKFCAIAFHLWHFERLRTHEDAHYQLVEEVRKKHISRIDNGIDKYVKTKKAMI